MPSAIDTYTPFLTARPPLKTNPCLVRFLGLVHVYIFRVDDLTLALLRPPCGTFRRAATVWLSAAGGSALPSRAACPGCSARAVKHLGDLVRNGFKVFVRGLDNFQSAAGKRALTLLDGR